MRSTTAEATARAVLRDVTDRLAAAGVHSPRADAEIVVAHVLGVPRSMLVADLARELSSDELAEAHELVARRARREPLAYVLGEWGFRRLALTVDSRVLVPRPETEVVVERCLACIAGQREPHVLDVGTGSGAVALAIADEHAGARVTGIDRSAGALAVAFENARLTTLDVELLEWDLFDGLPRGPWDLVVSNPPYVAADEIDRLEPEVREWEPRIALVADGATEAIAQSARSVLQPGGALVLETADGEAARVAELLDALSYRGIRVTRDLTGRPRVVEGVS